MRNMIILAALAIPVAATAQTQTQAEAEGPRTPIADQRAGGEVPQRIRSVTVNPGETCPPSTDDEVIVCYTPGGSPYRIPPGVRNDGPIPPANQSWVNRAATTRQVSREAAGLPNTCSPVGTGGQTGCAGILSPDFTAERRERRRQERLIPGGED